MSERLHTITVEIDTHIVETKEEVIIEFAIEPRDADVGILYEVADLRRVLAYRDGKEVDILDDLSTYARGRLQQRADKYARQEGWSDDDYY